MKQEPPHTLIDVVVTDPSEPRPWKNYTGSHDAIAAIERFADGKGLSWALLPSTAAELSDTTDAPQRAFVRQVIRAENETLERLASESSLALTNAADAVANLVPQLPSAKNDSVRNRMLAVFARVDVYSHREEDPDNNVVDVRDFGRGFDRYSVLDVFDELTGHPWAIPLHFAARASYECAPYTIVASRRAGRPVSVTAIKCMSTARGNRYIYLREADGGLPTLKVPEELFPAGTLVRHLQYEAPFYNAFKENSVQGALDRILPAMPVPVSTCYHDLVENKTHQRLATGAIQRLAVLIADDEAEIKTSRCTTTRVLANESCEVSRYKFLRADGKKTANNVLRQLCRPGEPILFLKDGQTIATAKSKQLPMPSLLMIDVSRFTAANLKRVCSDPKWRDELVDAVLNSKREIQRTVEVSGRIVPVDVRPSMRTNRVEVPARASLDAEPTSLSLRMISAVVRRLARR